MSHVEHPTLATSERSNHGHPRLSMATATAPQWSRLGVSGGAVSTLRIAINLGPGSRSDPRDAHRGSPWTIGWGFDLPWTPLDANYRCMPLDFSELGLARGTVSTPRTIINLGPKPTRPPRRSQRLGMDHWVGIRPAVDALERYLSVPASQWPRLGVSAGHRIHTQNHNQSRTEADPTSGTLTEARHGPLEGLFMCGGRPCQLFLGSWNILSQSWG
jgi:hypothetical protein